MNTEIRHSISLLVSLMSYTDVKTTLLILTYIASDILLIGLLDFELLFTFSCAFLHNHEI